MQGNGKDALLLHWKMPFNVNMQFVWVKIYIGLFFHIPSFFTIATSLTAMQIDSWRYLFKN